jgi:NAD(P)-dependent dehydrogenase (short-subunit alcohol dehydrogenase family)
LHDRLERPVLVTGASSGIGRHLAQHLAGLGHPVYATARNEPDVDALGAIDGVTPIVLDVRNPKQIDAARGFVQEEGKGLYGLVNNAGIGGIGGFSTFTDPDMLEIFDVNVFGPHRVTNAFLPLLLESHGRIVNIGSQGGSITGKFFGPYTMTKHALEAYTESLAAELRPHGVWVSIVQPGGIVSRIDVKSEASTVRRLKSAQPPFREEAEELLKLLGQPESIDETLPESETNRKPSSPAIVADAVEDALFSETPRLRYLVGTRWEGDRVINALVDKLLDANQSPVHGYSRGELIEILDQHLGERRNGP